MFYAKRTVAEQKNRLPQAFRSNYEATQLDRIEIDGNTFQGYFEYSFLAEKSYVTQPTRADDGSIADINEYATFLTPRLVIKYNMMGIEDYRNLMLLLQSKNEFTVTFYDIVLNKRVTHKMYFATPQMPIIYQQYLKVMGIQEYTIELIGTNNDNQTNTVTYNYNLPYSTMSARDGYPTQEFTTNVSDEIGKNAIISDGYNDYRLSSQEVEEMLGGYYRFKNWNTKPDGSGFAYMDGETYYIRHDVTLYAQWEISQ